MSKFFKSFLSVMVVALTSWTWAATISQCTRYDIAAGASATILSPILINDDSSNLTVTITYEDGNEKTNISKVELWDPSTMTCVSFDEHTGTTGSSHSNNDYTLSATGYEGKTLVVKSFIRADNSNPSNRSIGTIEFSGNVTSCDYTGSFKINSQTIGINFSAGNLKFSEDGTTEWGFKTDTQGGLLEESKWKSVHVSSSNSSPTDSPWVIATANEFLPSITLTKNSNNNIYNFTADSGKTSGNKMLGGYLDNASDLTFSGLPSSGYDVAIIFAGDGGFFSRVCVNGVSMTYDSNKNLVLGGTKWGDRRKVHEAEKTTFNQDDVATRVMYLPNLTSETLNLTTFNESTDGGRGTIAAIQIFLHEGEHKDSTSSTSDVWTWDERLLSSTESIYGKKIASVNRFLLDLEKIGLNVPATGFTLSFWTKRDGVNNWSDYVGFGGGDPYRYLHVQQNSNGNLNLYRDDGDQLAMLENEDNGNGIAFGLSNEAYQLVTFVLDSESLHVYVNGGPQIAAKTENWVRADKMMKYVGFGGAPTSTGSFESQRANANPKIADVRICNQALDADSVMALYESYIYVTVTLPTIEGAVWHYDGYPVDGNTITVDYGKDVTVALKANEGYVFSDADSGEKTVDLGPVNSDITIENTFLKAAIGKKLYATLDAALEAATSGQTVTLTDAASDITLKAGVTLNPNGHVVGKVTDAYGNELTITDGVYTAPVTYIVAESEWSADPFANAPVEIDFGGTTEQSVNLAVILGEVRSIKSLTVKGTPGGALASSGVTIPRTDIQTAVTVDSYTNQFGTITIYPDASLKLVGMTSNVIYNVTGKTPEADQARPKLIVKASEACGLADNDATSISNVDFEVAEGSALFYLRSQKIGAGVALIANGPVALEGSANTLNLVGLSGVGNFQASNNWNDHGFAVNVTLPEGAENTYSGVLSQQGSKDVSLTVSGAGKLTLASANTYKGGTTVQSGATLEVKGIAADTVVLPEGKTVTVNEGATVNLVQGLSYVTIRGDGTTKVTGTYTYGIGTVASDLTTKTVEITDSGVLQFRNWKDNYTFNVDNLTVNGTLKDDGYNDGKNKAKSISGVKVNKALSGTGTIDSALTLANGATVAAPTVEEQVLTVTGTATVNGTATMTGNFKVAKLGGSGTLAVANNATGSLTVTGTSTFGGSLNGVGLVVDTGANLTLTGNSTVSTIDGTGTLTVQGEYGAEQGQARLTLTGNSEFGGILSVGEHATLRLTGVTNGDVKTPASLTIAGTLRLAGTASLVTMTPDYDAMVTIATGATIIPNSQEHDSANMKMEAGSTIDCSNGGLLAFNQIDLPTGENEIVNIRWLSEPKPGYVIAVREILSEKLSSLNFVLTADCHDAVYIYMDPTKHFVTAVVIFESIRDMNQEDQQAIMEVSANLQYFPIYEVKNRDAVVCFEGTLNNAYKFMPESYWDENDTLIINVNYFVKFGISDITDVHTQCIDGVDYVVADVIATVEPIVEDASVSFKDGVVVALYLEGENDPLQKKTITKGDDDADVRQVIFENVQLPARNGTHKLTVRATKNESSEVLQ